MKILYTTSLCLLLAACASTPSRTDVAAFTATLDELRLEAHIPGLSVAIVQDGKVILAHGFRFADLESRRPATPHNIASVTKPISATSAPSRLRWYHWKDQARRSVEVTFP